MSSVEQCKVYTVKKTDTPVSIDADWDKPVWADAEIAEVGYYMGDKPEHRPRVQFRLMYDESNIYVIFKVDDRYVRAVREDYQGMVCRDSCVEFFFTPGGDVSEGYFNLETNCIATMLLHHQKGRGVDVAAVSAEDARKIEIASTLSGPIEQEIKQDLCWLLEYRFPFSVMEKYAAVEMPASGVEWRANFYKCGDETSKPHWLTWSRIDLPRPDFHQPRFFGKLIFE